MKEALATFLADKLFESQTFLENSSKAIAALADFIREPKKDCAAAIEAATGYLAIRGALGRPMNGSIPPELGARIKKFSELGLRSYSKDEYETAVKISAKTAREEADRLTALSDYEAFFPSHRALLSGWDEYASELAEAKRLANIMDFKDLGLCAVEALRRRKDMRNYWKQRIASIMIDEFQDNNQIQKDLLYLLAERRDRTVEGIPSPADLEEGKLFFVGDEKQSIYRFRGADVSVFKSLSKELRPTSQASIPEAGNGPSLSLPNNYPQVPPGLHPIFQPLFRRRLDAEGRNPQERIRGWQGGDLDYSSFEADYAAMEEGLSSSPGEFPCLIRYYLMESRDEQDEEEPDTYQGIEDDDDRLAFEVADFIRTNRGALKVRRTSIGDGRGPPSEFRGFRHPSAQQKPSASLEKYLRTMRIPYKRNPQGLYSESPANDIYHILRYAVDPADRASYAAVLRSPSSEVSEEAFLEL
jgi:ATP-dependent helicase/nuclease subunit A